MKRVESIAMIDEVSMKSIRSDPGVTLLLLVRSVLEGLAFFNRAKLDILCAAGRWLGSRSLARLKPSIEPTSDLA